MPPDPCHGCRFRGDCSTAGLVNRLAIFEWLDSRLFQCTDFEEERFHGLEGVRA